MNRNNGRTQLPSAARRNAVLLNGSSGDWTGEKPTDVQGMPLFTAVANHLTPLKDFFIGFDPEGVDPVADQSRPRYLLVKHEYKSVKITIADILYFQGKGNYVAIHTKSQAIVALLTMNRLEQVLLPYGFIRSHKSFIVAFEHLEAVWNDKVQIHKKVIPIGGQYRDKFLEFMNRNCLTVNGALSLDS